MSFEAYGRARVSERFESAHDDKCWCTIEIVVYTISMWCTAIRSLCALHCAWFLVGGQCDHRWLEYLFSIWPFRYLQQWKWSQTEFFSNLKKLPNNELNETINLPKYFKKLAKVAKFCQFYSHCMAVSVHGLSDRRMPTTPAAAGWHQMPKKNSSACFSD